MNVAGHGTKSEILIAPELEGLILGIEDLRSGAVTSNVQGDVCRCYVNRHNIIIRNAHLGGFVRMDLPSHAFGYVFTGDANITTSVDQGTEPVLPVFHPDTCLIWFIRPISHGPHIRL